MPGDAASTATPVVIVGSGLAGYAVAREFRKLDKETPLVVLSRDHGGFYSKPMLSNALAGQKTAASLLMKSADKMAGLGDVQFMPKPFELSALAERISDTLAGAQ